MAGICTYPFSLQDVVDVVNPTTDDLIDCFSDADQNLFDPEYVGIKDNLANFRNYGCGILNLTAASTGCSDETLYYSVKSDNQNTPPAINDSFVVDMGGTTNTFIGGGLFYNYLYNGSFYRIAISNSGVVTTVQTC